MATMIQEFVFHRLRPVSRDQAVAQARQVAAPCVLHAFDAAVLDRALDLVARLVASSRLGGRDAVHAVAALAAGLSGVVSTDRDFERAPGLRRVDPADLRP